MRRAVVILGVLAIMPSAIATAQNFSVTNQGMSNITGTGARAMGMGGAFIAIADDATAASWNPAGLAQLSRPEISIVYDWVSGSYDFSLDYQRELENYYAASDQRLVGEWSEQWSAPGDFDDSFIAFASGTLPFRLWEKPAIVQASYRRMASFPDFKRVYDYLYSYTQTEYLAGQQVGDPDVTQYQQVRSENDPWSGGFDAYSVSFAIQPVEKLRLGLSVNYVDANEVNGYSYSRTYSDYPDDPYYRLAKGGYDFADFQFDLGIQWEFAKGFTVGLVYHSGFDADFTYEDTVRAEYNPDVWSSNYLNGVTYSHRMESTVKWPDGWGVGLSWKATDRLVFAVDYGETSWSDAKVDYWSGVSADEDGNQVVYGDDDVPFPYANGQNDTWTARVGVEYLVMTGGEVIVPLRAGYFQEKQLAPPFEYSFLPDYSIGDAMVLDGYSLGVGIVYKGFQFDVAWVHTSGDDSYPQRYSDSGTGTNPDTGEVYDYSNEVTLDQATDFSADRLLASVIYRF